MSISIAGPVVQVASGVYLDLLRPNPAHIRIADIATSLSKLCRFTGHTRQFYSVAQHSVEVSRLLPREIALAGLLHDAAEAYVGDVSSPLRMILPGYREIHDRVQQAVVDAFGLAGFSDPRIHAADMIMLATERRDLMPATGEFWPCLDGVEPCAHILRPLDHHTAHHLFEQRFDELTGAGLRNSLRNTL